jgi:hypothetical protein
MTQRDAVFATRDVVKPHGQLFSKGVLSLLALTTPVFAVIYWLTIPSGPWSIILALHVTVLIAGILAVAAYFNTAIKVGPDGVTTRDYFGRVRRVRSEDVGSIVLLDLYESNTLETAPLLLVCDQAGRPLLRMRGQFWSQRSMQQVIDAFDCPVTVPPESVSLSDLRRTSPELLYWFERGVRMRRA